LVARFLRIFRARNYLFGEVKEVNSHMPSRVGAVLYGIGLFVAALVLSIFVQSSAFAGTSGVISGKVTSADNGAALSGVKVSAVSPTGNYSATTNATGFYSLTGVGTDTYTMTFSHDGYDSYTAQGINVFADQSAVVDAALKPATKTIGKVTAHGVSGTAYQPKQTVDTYTMTQAQINTIQGNSMNISESNLITSLPGASLDSSGYPTIRGGRENEQGFQFEGIPYTDAFTNQFVNTLATPGLGLLSVQLTPGAGSAVFGNNGTGSLNLISRKGSYPAFSTAQLGIGGGQYFHALNTEFGTAAPDNRWSEYFAFSGQNFGFTYGNNILPAAQMHAFLSSQSEVDREFVNNFIYHFGKDNTKSLQLFYDDAQHLFIQGNGGNPFCFATCDAEYQALVGGISQALGGPGLTVGQIESITGLDPYQNSATQTLASANRAPGEYHQPNHSIKLQFDDNIDSSTFFSAKYYHVNSVVNFDFPAWEEFGGSINQGGATNGITADVTKQLGDKNLFKVGADFAFLHPTYNQPNPGYGVLSTEVGGGDPVTGLGTWEFLDFIPASDPNCPFAGACGALQTYFPNGLPKVPQNLEQSITNRQDWSFYLDDAYTFSPRFKVEPGVRLDAVNYRMPAPGVNPVTCTTMYVPSSWATPAPGSPPGTCPTAKFNVTSEQTQPRIVEPRIAMSYELGSNDALRFSYGRSVEFPPLGQVDLYVPPQAYAPYRNIPSFDTLGALLGAPGPAQCGIPGFQVTCVSYAEQLLWENQNTLEGVPMQPVKPELFDNYDFSYSHQFNSGYSFKLTPWYRRGYQATASTQLPLLGPGGVPIRNPDGTYRFLPPVVTNRGTNHATGLEFLLTKDATSYGLSGQFTATYINEYSNVIPLSASEDFFPSIPPASLLLGNLYRVGFLSPFQTSLDLNYQTKSGWRISPQFSYNIGYPTNAGLLTAAFINNNPYNIANTNFSGSINVAPNGTTQYVDPMNPGSFFSPNIAATRGTPESTWPGGKLTHPVTTANSTFEYNLGHNHLVGLTVTNIFNSIYSGPALNANYQPVATGLSGPLSGLHTLPFYPQLGQANYGPLTRGKDAYINLPNATGRTYYIYFQQKI
jgi:hypothetical protein